MIAQPSEDNKSQPQVLAPPPSYEMPQAGTPQAGTPQAGTPYIPSPVGQPGTPQYVNVGQPQPTPQLHSSEAARIGEEYRSGLLAQCAQGNHDRKTTFGVCGIITAVICFPIGLIALCIDTEDRCARCGVRL
ncbi:hypothetical protein D9611_004771 [Ephemerocybe angulata]|uniref:Brain protein I3 n=1 Tax=Ephemerocybe angulata TaxID=980116 RepID=A0A8H5B409_9AGAR|nr:hypothetical protein D9611_004771 [Tulosesus angulatus]